MSDGLRINKALAQAGICSRRAADELVLSGAVRINGEVVREPGVRVDLTKDRIEVNGRPLPSPVASESGHAYIMMNKPIEVVTTAKDPQGRRTVFDLLPEDLRRLRLLHVGRLDYFSEGLLVLTTDGDLTHRLTHPSLHQPKTYEVVVRGEVTPDKLEAMRRGMTLAEGERLAPVEADIIGQRHDGATRLSLVLVQGVNRQIRRMCRDLELTILRLVRVAQGGLHLGDLRSGAFRRLTQDEVSALRGSVGLK